MSSNNDAAVEMAQTNEFVDEDQSATTTSEKNKACSTPFFLVLVLMAAIILGVTLGLTLPNNDGDKKKTDANVRAPTVPPSPTGASPTAAPVIVVPNPTMAPVAKPPAEMTRTEYLTYQAMQYSGTTLHPAAEKALQWLIDEGQLDQSNPTSHIRQRYIAAVLYHALQGQFWERRELQATPKLNFLSKSPYCDWNDGSSGLFCDSNNDIVEIRLGTSSKNYLARKVAFTKSNSLTAHSFFYR